MAPALRAVGAFVVSVVAAAAIWLAKKPGESLEARVAATALVERHIELAEQVPWTIAVVVAGVVVGASWTVAEVGHSGAKVTWHDVNP